MTGGGEGDGLRGHWAGMRTLLTELERAAAAALGGDAETAPVREFIEHDEPGLALELLAAIAARAGLQTPPGFAEGMEEAARRMGLSDSEDLAEWRRRRGAPPP